MTEMLANKILTFTCVTIIVQKILKFFNCGRRLWTTHKGKKWALHTNRKLNSSFVTSE